MPRLLRHLLRSTPASATSRPAPTASARARRQGWPHTAQVRAESRRQACRRLCADSSSPPARWFSALRQCPCWSDPAKLRTQLESLWWLVDHAVAWLHLLLDEHGGREFHSLPAFLDACAQK